ncbi:UDP-glucuronosyltransferase 2B7 [Folsomia candida]|uniref:UDP-glucuronosyltransferase n=1 Tax=Folsomia candida TaxID=158441 RepID=A0A226CY02_FOLCA|nr:UDP-glucuronosyltransferase 2B7 [Folsomia candida]
MFSAGISCPSSFSGGKATCLPKGLTKEPNIHQIHSIDFDLIWKDYDLFALQERNEHMNPFTLFTRHLPKYCREMYDRPEIQSLYGQDFDLIILQNLFNECSLGFVYKIMTGNGTKKSTPLVLFSVISAHYGIVKYVGGHYPSSFVSNPFLNFGDEMTFTERFVNFGVNYFFQAVFSLYYVPVMEDVYKEKVGRDVPRAEEILGMTSLILSNGHFSLSRPKPNLPDVVDVGGMHCRKAEPLPKEIDDFLASGRGGDADDAGFILFSLGTNLLSSAMSPQKRAVFVSVFARLKQKVIWKYESDDVPMNVSKNVFLSKWIPQQGLLGHPKIRLFITHCGGGGTEEAVFHGVPLIGIPFYGDQPLNAQSAENRGYLVRLEWNDLTEDRLLEAINEVLNNPRYRKSVQELSAIFRDQVDNPLDRAVFWVEYVMRHNGAPHLRSAGRNLSLIQYHSLDVVAAYLVIIFASLFVLFILAKKILNLFGLMLPKPSKYKTT